MECLELLKERHEMAMEPTQAAYQRWNDAVDEKLKGLIWSHPKAHSYYRNSKGRIYLSSPYRLVEYWTMTRGPKVEDYAIE